MEENIKIYRRYIANISCIGGYRNDIWVNVGQWGQTCYTAPRYSAPQKFQFLLLRGLEPKQKVWGSGHLTTRASLPLVEYKALKIYIQSRHIKKILKEYFREQINYNNFIIKCKNFF